MVDRLNSTLTIGDLKTIVEQADKVEDLLDQTYKAICAMHRMAEVNPPAKLLADSVAQSMLTQLKIFPDAIRAAANKSIKDIEDNGL